MSYGLKCILFSGLSNTLEGDNKHSSFEKFEDAGYMIKYLMHAYTLKLSSYTNKLHN